MLRRKIIVTLLTGTLFAAMVLSCVESIDLPVKKSDVNFLVVDGYLNTVNAEVNVKLQRAGLISDSQLPFEVNAVVTLEDAEGNSYPLHELDSGNYQAVAPSTVPGKQYRIHINTVNGKEYRSAFVTLKSTPQIKELTWRAEADGTQIIIDTEDNSNESRYYRWTFEETWEYHTRYTSWWRFTGIDVDTIDLDEVAPRGLDELIKVCYKTDVSTRIYTTTTRGLTADVVNDFEIRFLPKGTEMLGYGYSILVKQYVINEETYEYLEKLKKTSQDLNGLYAPQPSKVTGNLFNVTDPSEIVLGYFDVGQQTEKRISITPQELPAHLRNMDESSLLCYIDTVKVEDLLRLNLAGDKYTLLDYISGEDQFPIAFTYTTNICADCRVRGGVTAKPDFWP